MEAMRKCCRAAAHEPAAHSLVPLSVPFSPSFATSFFSIPLSASSMSLVLSLLLLLLSLPPSTSLLLSSSSSSPKVAWRVLRGGHRHCRNPRNGGGREREGRPTATDGRTTTFCSLQQHSSSLPPCSRPPSLPGFPADPKLEVAWKVGRSNEDVLVLPRPTVVELWCAKRSSPPALFSGAALSFRPAPPSVLSPRH